ncbi:flagellar biosynthetic protein FliO [Helicobacter muridarum]|uniref:flagellar biosynthetic protein FliO n=1 Tax=Helicobacter muridarum TaxID=216 RepID=UPI00068E33CC|nr:flagellar biosynthetic protein FliO [Helicobacter muridarum]
MTRVFVIHNIYIRNCYCVAHCRLYTIALFMFVSIFFKPLFANSNLFIIKESYVVDDQILLNDFAKRYNLSMLLALRLDKPLINDRVYPNVIYKDGMLYATIPNITNLKQQRLDTSLGKLELNTRPNQEVYISLKSNVGYDIKIEAHGIMLYVIFAGTNDISQTLLSNKANILPVEYDTSTQIHLQNLNLQTENTSNIPSGNLSINSSSDISTQTFMSDEYDIGSWRYLSILGIMIALIILLYVVKLRQNKGTQISNITIKQVKILDSKNKIIIVNIGDMDYILGLNPNGMILIDKLSKSDQCLDSDKNSQENSEHDISSFDNLLLKKGISEEHTL